MTARIANTLSPKARADAQRVLDGIARRMLDEKIRIANGELLVTYWKNGQRRR